MSKSSPKEGSAQEVIDLSLICQAEVLAQQITTEDELARVMDVLYGRLGELWRDEA